MSLVSAAVVSAYPHIYVTEGDQTLLVKESFFVFSLLALCVRVHTGVALARLHV